MLVALNPVNYNRVFNYRELVNLYLALIEKIIYSSIIMNVNGFDRMNNYDISVQSNNWSKW